ncbi:MAG: M81 family metallopeptidase [Steroidobacteraceae bacterium]|jgi:microcystin degradation protein MlrC
MKRIAIGGWQHETNTFAPFDTDYRAFEMADGWPALAEGPAIIEAVAGINMPIEGFIQTAKRAVELVPTLWTSAEPAGYVRDDAFERIAERLCGAISGSGPLDGVYLDLHGAMVTRRFDDAEGELLERVRALIGPRIPLVASLDFHANISARMVRAADALTVYRTYPHIDMAETGARAAEVLLKLAQGARSFKAYRQGEYLVPLHMGATEFEPNRRLFGTLLDLSNTSLTSDIALGFPPSDVPDAGPSILAYAHSADRAEHIVEELYRELVAAEARYQGTVLEPDAAIARARANRSDRPVILADTQDNSGAGGTSDMMSPVIDLIRHGARGAVVAIVTDPEFAARAHASGIGGIVESHLGGKLGNAGRPGAGSMLARFRVLALGDGKLVCTGPVSRGARMNLGAMALVAVEDAGGADVKIVVSSIRSQPLDQAMLRHVGVEPAHQRIIVLKSSVHFRADFDPLAAETLVVEWPGCNYSDPSRCSYRNLRPRLRLRPNGPMFQP